MPSSRGTIRAGRRNSGKSRVPGMFEASAIVPPSRRTQDARRSPSAHRSAASRGIRPAPASPPPRQRITADELDLPVVWLLRPCRQNRDRAANDDDRRPRRSRPAECAKCSVQCRVGIRRSVVGSASARADWRRARNGWRSFGARWIPVRTRKRLAYDDGQHGHVFPVRRAQVGGPRARARHAEPLHLSN